MVVVFFWLLVACAEPWRIRFPTLPPTLPPPTNAAFADLAQTNLVGPTNLTPEISPAASNTNSAVQVPVAVTVPEDFNSRLATARYLETTRQFSLAKLSFLALLAGNVPDEIRRPALFELGAVAQAENDLPRAQSIYAQYYSRWPETTASRRCCCGRAGFPADGHE